VHNPVHAEIDSSGYQRECLLRPDFVVLTDEATGHIIFSVKMGGLRRLGGSRMATDFQFNNDTSLASVVSCESTWIGSEESCLD